MEPNKCFHATAAPVTSLACASAAPCRLRRLRLHVKHNVRQDKRTGVVLAATEFGLKD